MKHYIYMNLNNPHSDSLSLFLYFVFSTAVALVQVYFSNEHLETGECSFPNMMTVENQKYTMFNVST